MEFLDKLVLPQSAEHIELLHYMTVLVLSLFVPFISIVFGGTFLSIQFRKKANKLNDEHYAKLSRDIIEYVTVNNSVGVILGIIPILTLILIFAQLLHTAQINTTILLVISFLLVTVALIMIYTYRHSSIVNFVINSLENISVKNTDAQNELNRIKNTSFQLSIKYGKLGLVFLFVGIWFFVAGYTSAIKFSDWNLTGIFTSLASPAVLLNLVIFICFAFMLTAAAVLFVHLYWKDDKKNENPEYTGFLKDKISKIGFKFGIPLPLFITLSILTISGNNLSGTIFVYSVIAILLIFLAYHQFYMIEIKNEYKFSSLVFFILILASVSMIIKDQKAMSNSTELHSLALSTEYNKILAELKGEGIEAVINAKELYDVRCASCHKFDQKLVGPAHLDVLPKYVGKEAQLVAFIRNPVKVDPAYPPMPNPGLKPQEAEAVAKYLLEEFEKRK